MGINIVMIRTQYHISQEEHYNMHLHESIPFIISKHATCERVLFTTQTQIWYQMVEYIYILFHAINRIKECVCRLCIKICSRQKKVCQKETRSFYKQCDAVCCKRFHSKLL